MKLSRFQIDTLIVNCRETKVQLKKEKSTRKTHSAKSLFNHLIENQDKCIETLIKMRKEDVALSIINKF